MTDALARAVAGARGKVVALLAAKFRDLDLAEEGFAEACLKAAQAWAKGEPTRDPAAWLYRVAYREVLQSLRRRRTHNRLVAPEPNEPASTAEDDMTSDHSIIPDERLRLIFVCCHPALSPEARVALTLRVVCGLETSNIAAAFLTPETTIAQRLVRAKRKIAEAHIPFETPDPDQWPERMEAVLAVIEIAYAQAHAGAAGGYANEILDLLQVLTRLAPDTAGASALAAIAHYSEARRAARLGIDGRMIPLSEQDPQAWDARLLAQGDFFLARAVKLAPQDVRVLQAQLQAVWRARRSLADPPPWTALLAAYDRLLAVRNDPVVRVNRAVALSNVDGPEAALVDLATLDASGLAAFAPYHAVRADLLSRLGRDKEALTAYQNALACDPPGLVERAWLEARMAALKLP